VLFGRVKILFTIIKRSDVEEVIASIKQFNPQAFYTIEDVRMVNEDAYSPVGADSNRKNANGVKNNSREALRSEDGHRSEDTANP
jgi:hypothetical protein